MKKRKVIVVANQKGGVGKTTTALVLQSMYKMAGIKSLFIDFEIQGNGTKVHQALVEDTATTYDVFIDNNVKAEEKIHINEAIQHTEYGDIVAHDKLLAIADSMLNSNTNGNYVVVDALEELSDDYEVVIIDTQPALNKLLIASLIAATHVIIPFTKEDFSMQGLSQLNQTIIDVKKRQNPNLIIEGLLITRVYGKNTLFGDAIMKNLDIIADRMNTKVFKSQIRESTKLKESQSLNMSLFDYDKRSTTAIDYMNFFSELENVDLIHGKDAKGNNPNVEELICC